MFTKRENEETVLYLLRWSARVLSLSAVFLMLLVMGGRSSVSLTFVELVGLFFFPLGVLVGYFVAWRYELYGGSISLVAIAAYYLVYGSLLLGSMPNSWVFAAFGLPGLLFAAHGVLSRVWFGAKQQYSV